MKKVSVATLLAKKQQAHKFATLTAYDASFAKIFDEAGIDLILIGDSLGMVLQGESSTLPVTVAQVAYHTRCVASSCQRAPITLARSSLTRLVRKHQSTTPIPACSIRVSQQLVVTIP